MKKVYSILLLFTFLVGALQPILPMVEYQLFEGHIIELLADEAHNKHECCQMVHCLADRECPDCEGWENKAQLLDIDFYPIALEISAISNSIMFPVSARLYVSPTQKVIGPAFLPIPPPPPFELKLWRLRFSTPNGEVSG